jgi:hypothetical protein
VPSRTRLGLNRRQFIIAASLVAVSCLATFVLIQSGRRLIYDVRPSPVVALPGPNGDPLHIPVVVVPVPVPAPSVTPPPAPPVIYPLHAQVG